MSTFYRNSSRLYAILLLVGVLCLPVSGWATDWYVRPLGGTYGAENGTSYAAAFDGFADIAWGSLAAGDVLYVCGAHTEELAPSVSGAVGNHLTIDGACPDDSGSIDTTAIASNVVDAIRIENQAYWTVQYMTVSGRRAGIHVYSSSARSGYSILHNTVDQRNAGTVTNPCHGIALDGNSTYAYRTVRIEHNTILGTKVTCANIFNDAIHLENATADILVTGNTATESYSGVDISGTSTGPYVIASNALIHLRGNGVRIEGSLGCPAGLVVTGNLIVNPGQWGVTWLDNANSVLSNNTIQVFHDAAQNGLAPYGAIQFGGIEPCAETGNIIRNNILEANYSAGVMVHYESTRSTFESTNTWDHNRINQSGGQTTLIGWLNDAGNNMTEANQSTWATAHNGDTYGDISFRGAACTAQTCLSSVSSMDLRLPLTSPLRRSGGGGSCLDYRGRVCPPGNPNIGAYQSTSGDPAATRAVRN